MKKGITKLILSLITFLVVTIAQANGPLWTLEPVAGYPSSITVSTSEAATIKYKITNQSHKPHTLEMNPIQGITSSGCTSSLNYHQSCVLSLKGHWQ